jgi:hypothetical protein
MLLFLSFVKYLLHWCNMPGGCGFQLFLSMQEGAPASTSRWYPIAAAAAVAGSELLHPGARPWLMP